MTSHVVIGQNRYGTGTDLAEAKRNFRRFGGRLSDGYTVIVFPPELEFAGVDEMGRVSWHEPIVCAARPEVTEVPPRKRSKDTTK